MNKDKILLYTSLLRIICSIFLLYYCNIPLYIKIIIIIFFIEMIDVDIPRLFRYEKIWKYKKYNLYDKITDSIIYIILFIYIYNK